MRPRAPWAITFADLLTQCVGFMVILPAVAAHEPHARSAEPAASEPAAPLAALAAPDDDASRAGEIRIPLAALFEPGSATPRPGFEPAIEEAARVAAYDVPGGAELRVVAEGGEKDLALALARADAAARALARAGNLPRERFAIAGRAGDGDGAVLVVVPTLTPTPNEDVPGANRP